MSEQVELDEVARAALADVDAEERILAASLNTARSTILRYFCRQNKLDGDWRLAENKREIVKVEGNGNGRFKHEEAQGVAGE